jgi:uncharacterized LabA/DUF88 family protein
VPEPKERRIALFIDFENLVTNTGITAASFDLQPPLDRLLEKGKVVFRRAYCDWSRFREAKAHLHEHGVELVEVPPSTRSGKNAADMRLVIDALELAYAREHIDTYVIASGDSDFVPLANKLREMGRFIIGLAVKQASSPMFIKACDEFIYLSEPQRHSPRATPARGRSGVREREKKERGQVPAAAREVVQSLLARATGPLNPSFIKETLVRKQPDFDEREYGFSTFLRLLEALEKEGLLRRQQQGRQWYVIAPDAPAAEPVALVEIEEEEAIPDPED